MTTGRATSGLLRAHAWLVYAFLYAPILVLIVYSFNDSAHTAEWKGPTTRWYAAAIGSRDLTQAARSSLLVAAIATAAATVVGTMAALALHGLRSRGRRGGGVTRALLLLPIVVPEVVIGAASLVFIIAIGWERGFWPTAAAHVAFCVSYVAVVVRARLAGFDPALEEAARDLGAPPAAVFWRVKLPLILPGVVAAALLAFTLSIDDYVITSFTSGAGLRTLPMEIQSRLTVKPRPDLNAVSTLLLVFTMALVAAAGWLMGGRGRKGERP